MKKVFVLLGVIGIAVAAYATYYVDTNTNYTELTFNNMASAADSARVTTNAIAIGDQNADNSLYNAVAYQITIADADTCCGDTNGVTNGLTRLAKVDTGKIILQAERNGTWYTIRTDSGVLPYSKHIYIDGDSLFDGYDNIRFQLYAADTAGSADSIGWGVTLDTRLVK